MSRHRIARFVLKLIGFVGLLLLLAYILFDMLGVGGVSVPDPQRVGDVVYPKQEWQRGWEQTQSDWYHHASQGTRILPYSWFMALEQPDLSPFHTPGKFHSIDYLERFGFLPSDTDGQYNPDGLPIGFAIEEEFHSPLRDQNDPLAAYTKVVGLTCAACHTGQLNYKDGEGKIRGIRIEGGSAMISLVQFQEAVARALLYTDLISARFTRFARGVLTEEKQPINDETVRRVRRQLKGFLQLGLESQRQAKLRALTGTEAGFSRTDALGLIGNRVFGRLSSENLSVTDAPVNFPHLWDTSWFDWVQYNSSIRMPMVRNIGEALGVGALVNVDALGQEPIQSTVRVENLHLMEDMLGGMRPLEGLRPPKWSDTGLPAIDTEKRDQGRALYAQYCQSCHLPPQDELARDLERKEPHYWYQTAQEGRPVLRLKLYSLQQIGTDPNQALNFYRRVAVAGIQNLSAAQGLYQVTGEIRDLAYQGFSPEQVALYDRFRKFDPKRMEDVIRMLLAYKARPLDGIWATPPYLHNSSVPSLYQVLLPARVQAGTYQAPDRARWRSATFYLGTKMFDPVEVGYVTDAFRGGFRMDTALPGNSNLGHEYRNLTLEELESAREIKSPTDSEFPPVPRRWARVLDLPVEEWDQLSNEKKWARVRDRSRQVLEAQWKGGRGFKGVIGVELTEEERWRLVEYLKSL